MLIASLLVPALASGQEPPRTPPDSTDRALAGILAAALSTGGASVWPSYRFAADPLLAYRPGGWAVLVGFPGTELPGWRAYPGQWAELGRPALFREHAPTALVGQLAFDYEVAGHTVVALPLFADLPPELGARDRQLFAFLVHEAFHAYQQRAFRDTDTPSEEVYPLLDPENNALAALEMLTLMEALRAVRGSDEVRARDASRRAAAVHAARWQRLGRQARLIERSKEVVEGTAKYVEARSVGLLVRACSAEDPPPAFLCRQFEGEDPASWLIADMQGRLAGGALDPRDMPRLRVYSVGGALGLLLDDYSPGWKSETETAGTRVSLFDRLASALELGPSDDELLERSRRLYDWDRLLSAAADRVAAYRADFERVLREFRQQPGLRLSIELPQEGVSRGRSSRGRRWIVDEGRRVLGDFKAFTLRRRGEMPLRLSIEDHAVLDETDVPGRRRVTVPVPTAPTVTADGRAVDLREGETLSFETLELQAEGVDLVVDAHGRIARGTGTVRVEIEPSAEDPTGIMSFEECQDVGHGDRSSVRRGGDGPRARAGRRRPGSIPRSRPWGRDPGAATRRVVCPAAERGLVPFGEETSAER